MTYTYICSSCNEQWDDRQLMADRDLPTSQPCPHCNSEGTVKRTIAFAPRISYEGGQTVLQRAGSGWNDVLNKVKKSSGRKTNIETR